MDARIRRAPGVVTNNHGAALAAERPAGADAGADAKEGFSFVSIANVALRHRTLIATITLLLGAIVAWRTLAQPRTYTSTASFIAEGRQQESALSGFAAQFGVRLPTTPSTSSPQFYQDLLESREILRQVIGGRYFPNGDTTAKPQTLIQLYDLADIPEPERHERALERIRREIKTELSAKTGVVLLRVRATTPALAEQINSQLVEQLNQFNLIRRQSAATSERTFTERRLAEARTQLRSAEGSLRDFREHNRDYRNSAALQLEDERLQREVFFQQQIYSSLAQALEQAKIEEVRDTPAITFIEQPNVPGRPDPRNLIQDIGTAILAGAFIGLLLAFWRDYFARLNTTADPEVDEFVTLWQTVRTDIRHPLNALRRSRAERSSDG